MTEEEKFQRLKTLNIDILSQSGNCEASQQMFGAATCVHELCEAWYKYWFGLVTEVPKQVAQAFSVMYSEIKDEVNAAGIFYNEDSPQGYVIIGDSTEPIHLYRARHAYVLGNAHVVLHACAHATGMSGGCTIELLDSSTATIDNGYGIARDRSELTTKCDAECHGSAKVRITDAVLTDNGHLRITAYGTATVRSFTDRLIYLYDSSTIEPLSE